jgi:uncharacterized membrane protein
MNGIGLAVLAGLCWGVGELCTKSVLHGHRIGPMAAIAVRSTIALPFLWLAWFLAVRVTRLEPAGSLRSLPAADIAKLVLGSGFTAGALGMIFFYAALNLDDISRVKPIAFTIAPATAVLLGWMLLGESFSLRKAVAVGLILLGVGLLTTGGGR